MYNITMFCDRLRDLRALKNMKQKDVASILRMSTTGYSSWEQGLSQPSIEQLKKLCRIFDTTLSDLLEMEDIPPLSKRVSVNPPAINMVRTSSKSGETHTLVVNDEEFQKIVSFINEFRVK